ncbi:hypothetical protein NC653_008917 [Populus alba x Populus x berolinensis]|uniref:Uncharacterized protein n=1 Tax=Populus alba x Populus x berolinensis TaxID=444605 RepID=A0AAD6R808_9ROSI|nr:hypothetical protein NC653_008917 [Populus alba x Populus x berolinensis]
MSSHHSWAVTLSKLNSYDLRGWPKLSKAGCPQLAKLAHVPVKDNRKVFLPSKMYVAFASAPSFLCPKRYMHYCSEP